MTAAARTRLWIIQFADAPTHDDRALIALSGAEVVDYLPFNARMVSIRESLPRAWSDPSVRFSGWQFRD